MRALPHAALVFRKGATLGPAAITLALLSATTIQAEPLTERGEEAQRLCELNAHLSGLDCSCIAMKFVAFDAEASENSVDNIFYDLMLTDVSDCVMPEQVFADAMRSCNNVAPYGILVNNRNLSQDELCECLANEMVDRAKAGLVISGRVLTVDALLSCGN